MEEIIQVLSKYKKDFSLMDHDQIKDVAASIDGFVHDLRSCDWNWDRYVLLTLPPTKGIYLRD